MNERQSKRVYVRYCVACIDKLRDIRIAGTDKPRYHIEELEELPRGGQCPLCGQYAHMGVYILTRNAAPVYRKKTGGGERRRAGAGA